MRSKKPQVNPGATLVDVLGEIPVCGIIFLHGDNTHASLTAEAATALGLAEIGEKPVALAKLPAPLLSFCEALLSKRNFQTHQVLELRLPGKEITRLRMTGVVQELGEGQRSAVVVLNDLTSTRVLEQHLQQVARLSAIGTLSASMAHEIKNALVAGKTFIDLLLEKHQDEELVEIVRRELGRIDALVSETLRFAKHAKPNLTTLRLHDVLAHSLRLIQPQLDTKLVQVETVFSADPDWIAGDERHLQQAFVNLFLNAAEAMGPHGKLLVTTDNSPTAEGPEVKEAAEPGHLRVTIKDTGAGIPPDALSRLFEPFFTTKPTGTGLGLPITWRIIQEHRGNITVDSRVGEGATFFVLLPALPAPA